jgi:hypothetical protein
MQLDSALKIKNITCGGKNENSVNKKKKKFLIIAAHILLLK